MNPLYPVVAARADHRCEYCRAPEAIFNLRFEVEHILPTSREGRDEVSNCAGVPILQSSQIKPGGGP